MHLKARIFCVVGEREREHVIFYFTALIDFCVFWLLHTAGIVSTIATMNEVQSITCWSDPLTPSGEWLVLCDGTGFRYRNLTPGSDQSKSMAVTDFCPGRECAFAVTKDGSIIYYNHEWGLSIIKPTQTQTKPVRLCDALNRPKMIKAVATNRDRVIALTAVSLHLISLSSGGDPLLIEKADANGFDHCVFADWRYPTLLASTVVDGPYDGNILLYEFGCECPAEVSIISWGWSIVTDYAGALFVCRATRLTHTDCNSSHALCGV